MKGSDISIVLQSQSASAREVLEQTFSDLRNRLIISDFRVKRLVAKPRNGIAASIGPTIRL